MHFPGNFFFLEKRALSMVETAPKMLIVRGRRNFLEESTDKKTMVLASLLTVFIVLTISMGIFSLVLLLRDGELPEGEVQSHITQNAMDSTDTVTMDLLKKETEIYRQRSVQLEKLMMLRMARGEGRYKIAFLTFDDGPSANTAKVLDILNQYGVKATFFVIGNDTDWGRALYQRIVTEGHALGNHTYTHEYGEIYRSPGSFWQDFYRLEELLYATTATRPTLMRFPGGSNNQVSRKAGGRGIMKTIVSDMTSRGYFHVDWDIESGDASRVFRSGDYLYKRVIGNLGYYDSAVILFHDTKKNTPLLDALPRIIEEMTAEGYVFLPVTEAYYPLMPRFQE
jgi:peptidoglycan/xylan/chitin deacetylase (PgdA/CDA1 family)